MDDFRVKMIKKERSRKMRQTSNGYHFKDILDVFSDESLDEISKKVTRSKRPGEWMFYTGCKIYVVKGDRDIFEVVKTSWTDDRAKVLPFTPKRLKAIAGLILRGKPGWIVRRTITGYVIVRAYRVRSTSERS